MEELKHLSNFELTAIPPYCFELTARKPLGYHWLTPSEVFSNGILWTAIGLSSGKIVGLRLNSMGDVEQPRVLVAVFSDEKITNEEEGEILDTVTRCAELEVNIADFYHVAEQDRILQQAIIDLYGMRCGKQQCLFHGLVRAITMQWASLTRTRQMQGLLLQEYGRRVAFDGHTIVAWFTPEQIDEVPIKELKETCKLGFRARYLKAIAKSVRDGKCPTSEELEGVPFERAKAELMMLEGMGEYSAEIALPHSERFPIDVWSMKMFWRLFFPHEALPPPQIAIRKVRQRAEERWGKWRGYAFIYVINDFDNLSKLARKPTASAVGVSTKT
ncbi:MAG: hypothetical protein AOA65_1554 [Candidatus Bathyarchaeota archaeon BA1]|nr:MAG: hypothetical protein AOA65_1554 [Candidatus Bathyarchaeota archaeon BA1]